MASQRIKVEVALLIKTIEVQRDALQGDYDKALAKHGPALDAWHAKAAQHLQDAFDGLVSGDDIVIQSRTEWVGGASRQGVWIPTPRLGAMPTPPSRVNVAQHNKDLALLRMSSESTISLSTDDRYGRYL